MASSPISPALKSALNEALADQKLSLEEWQRRIEPIVDAEGPVASVDSHAILAAWANDHYEVDPQVRQWMHDYLRSRGYAMPDARPQGSNVQVVKNLAKSNVGETDTVFGAMAKAAGKTNASVNVAVIDNGFDLWHPELGHKGWQNPGEVASNGRDEDGNGRVDDSNGWDYLDWNNDVGNPTGDWHGTHVAGIATEGTDQLSVIPLRVLSGATPYDPRAAADAIDYAAEHGARVVNMSFGIDTPEKVAVLKAAMERHPELLFVVAAGNDNRALGSYDPGTFLNANGQHLPNLCVVASCDADGKKSGFSNYGPEATLAARGSDVLSTIPGARYESISGTSMAAPQVVNAAGKCLVLDPALRPEQLKQLLSDTSDRRDDWKGLNAASGTINTERACRLAALTGLVRGGMGADGAATKLHLSQADRARLVPLVGRYVS